MSGFNQLTVRQLTAILLAWVLFAPSAPVLAANRKGDKLWNGAHVAEAKGNLDEALQDAEEALQTDPTDIGYQLEVRRIRFEAGALHVKNGQQLRNAGKLSEALAEFQKAYEIDPASDIAMQEIRRTQAMIQRNAAPGDAGAAAKNDDKNLTPAELARKRHRIGPTRFFRFPSCGR